MNPSHYRRTFSFATTLAALAILSSSCKQESTETREERLNPRAKAYLDNMAAKEESNIEKGWDHVEGSGYYYEKPEGWTESKDIKKGVYSLLTSPKNDLKIHLISRYIESIPEGVHDLTDWAELQYSSMGMPEALEEMCEIEVANGEALQARVTIRDTHLLVRYFVDMFQNPKNQRMWLLLVEAKDESRIESPEIQHFLDTFRVENFRWIDRDAPDITSPNQSP